MHSTIGGLMNAPAMVLMVNAIIVVAAAGCRSAAPHTAGRVTALETAGSPESPFEEARRLFYLAADGDREALRKCPSAIEACGGGVGDESVKLLAYRGGCEMLEAGRAALPWDKGAHARRGLAVLDDAVARAPDDLEVRFVRGMTSYHLPRFMGRAGVAASDLAAVAGEAEAAVASGRLERPLAAAALYHYGVLLAGGRKQPAANAIWRRAVHLAPQTPGGRAAADRLAR